MSKQLEDKAVANLPETARAWLTEDVAYIITREERCAFLKLDYDEEREEFVEQFWNRRSPNPDSLENNFKEEHYRRIVFANDKFGTQIPGWRTDRGRIYILFGPPDKTDSFPTGGCPDVGPRGPEEGCGMFRHLPWEQWQYKYIEGDGVNVNLEFIDPEIGRAHV